MAYCRNCGKEIDETATFCPNCGASQYLEAASYTPAPIQIDNGGIGWGLLGCCIPVAGLILWLVWKDTKPKTAKAAGIGALVFTGIVIVYYILIIVIGIGAAII